MLRFLLVLLACALWPGRGLPPAAAGDTEDAARVDALLGAVVRALDRVVVVEQALSQAAGRMPAALVPPAGAPGPAAQPAAELPEGWVLSQGLPLPARGRFKHHYSVLESGPPRAREVSVKGLYLLKQTPHPKWLERGELRLRADPFDAEAGRPPSLVSVELVIRSYARDVGFLTARNEGATLRLMYGSVVLPSGMQPDVRTENTVEGANVEMMYTYARWTLPLREFLAWIQAPPEHVGIGWPGFQRPTLVFKGPALNAARDLASRFAPVSPAPAKAGSPAPKSPPAAGAQDATATSDAQAVEAGLAWLAAHQSPDGSWGAESFGRWCDGVENPGERPDGPGLAVYDVGVTGLALTAFLSSGYSPLGSHPHAKVVRRGLSYLIAAQDVEGCFGSRSTHHYIYNHGSAAHALVEAYGASRNAAYLGPAQRGLDFIALARNPGLVWRYGVRTGENDTSLAAWMSGALVAARRVNTDAVSRREPAPLVLDEGADEGCRAWLDRVTDRDFGRVGYTSRGSGAARPEERADQFPPEQTESMTAAGMWLRMAMGDDPPTHPLVKKGATLCARLRPRWTPNVGNVDLLYWYYGTLAMRRMGEPHWIAWRAAVRSALLDNQRSGPPCSFGGSWDPIDPWGQDGGRVYSTAMAIRILSACR